MEEKFLQIGDNKIRYIESGNSRDTLVLIHGLGASAERWDKVIPLFSKKYKVIVPDIIGFGYSDKPLVDYTPDFFSEFLENFFIASNIKRPNLIGSSLGGQIAADGECRFIRQRDRMCNYGCDCRCGRSVNLPTERRCPACRLARRLFCRLLRFRFRDRVEFSGF